MGIGSSLLAAIGGYGALAAAVIMGVSAIAVFAITLRGTARTAGARRRVFAYEADAAVPHLVEGGGKHWERLTAAAKALGRIMAPPSEKVQGDLGKRMRQAGLVARESVLFFYGARAALVLGLPFCALFVAQIITPGLSAAALIAISACAAGLGFIGPSFYLDTRISTLKQEMRGGFPDMLDLLVICMEAGMSFEAGFERVSNELDRSYPHLRRAMSQTILELRAGKDRSAALFAFAERLALEEAASFANMILQAEQLGSGVANALRVCADEMRDRRLLKAEEYANALPVMLVIPLGAFIFPAILVVTLLPAGISIFQTLIAPQ